MTAPTPADHPHTDPGDGRTECDRCGKFVWPAIHSCKGVPVTAAARARWDAAHPDEPVTAPTPADAARYVESITTAADVLRAYLEREDPDVSRLLFNQDYEAMAMALADAGRLLPADTDTRTEPDLWQYGCPDPDEGPDAVMIFDGEPRYLSPRYLRRPMRAVGPWLPVPSTQETP